jgi:aerobic carbon-monoxide dehydrogenase small subunit
VIPASERQAISLNVNGEQREVEVESTTLLVDLVRDGLALKATHAGCYTGDCGACTVRLDGAAVKACCVLAATADGSDLVTLEGLGTPDALHPLQELFWARHAFQCGFCLPGMIFSALELLENEPKPAEADVRRALDGTLCRCTGYQNQVAAVLEASQLGRPPAA